MEKLKILIVFNSLMGVIGGGSRHIVYVTDYWCISNKIQFLISKSGYRVAKEYIQKNPNFNKEAILYSTPFDDSKNRILVYLSRIVKNILMVPKLKREYDVIIAPNYLPQNTIPAIFLKRGKKIVVYFHTVPPSLRMSYLKGMDFLRRAISILNWKFCVFLARFFDLIFVVNEATRDYFIEKRFAPEKLVVVDNGIPYKEILDAPFKDDEYDGVFLARLVKRKGIYDLIEIWKEVTDVFPFAKLCVIGAGTERENLGIKIEEEGLDKNITLVGSVSDKKKYELLKSSKIFVFPSYYESWGIVIAEAMACGLPVIAYDSPIYKEVFNGYVFTIEIGDCKGMAKKIIDILENREAYGKISKQAKKFVSKYDWAEIANQELSCIEKIIFKEGE